MSSRQYIKRVWRVPKDRGALEYLAALVVKSLVKHGWPAKASIHVGSGGFQIYHINHGPDGPRDFMDAVAIAVRIVARTYRVDITEFGGFVVLQRAYVVTPSGAIKEA